MARFLAGHRHENLSWYFWVGWRWYAITNGAEIIWDVDSDNSLFPGEGLQKFIDASNWHNVKVLQVDNVDNKGIWPCQELLWYQNGDNLPYISLAKRWLLSF